MSDTYLDDDETNERTVTLRRDQIDVLEKQAKTAGDSLARAEAAERKLAFAEAGLPLNDPKMAYFVKGYDGDINTEAIRTAATEAGFLTAPVVDVDAEALARTQQVAAGATSANAGPEQAYFDAMNAAETPEQVVAVAAKFGRLHVPQ